jgi:hypothetical protein
MARPRRATSTRNRSRALRDCHIDIVTAVSPTQTSNRPSVRITTGGAATTRGWTSGSATPACSSRSRASRAVMRSAMPASGSAPSAHTTRSTSSGALASRHVCAASASARRASATSWCATDTAARSSSASAWPRVSRCRRASADASVAVSAAPATSSAPSWAQPVANVDSVAYGPDPAARARSAATAAAAGSVVASTRAKPPSAGTMPCTSPVALAARAASSYAARARLCRPRARWMPPRPISG